VSDEKKIKFDETVAFTFLQKKKKSHFAFINEEALIHQTTQNDTKASCLLLLPLIMLLG
jgi:hypothetical protein